jgi:arsenate reductase
MKAVIYHNPMCGTSRKTLDILRDSGCDVWVQEYLKIPPSKEELKRLYERAGIRPRDGLRSKEPLAEELGLKRPDVTDGSLLEGVKRRKGGMMTTESVVMRASTGTVRWVKAEHHKAG